MDFVATSFFLSPLLGLIFTFLDTFLSLYMTLIPDCDFRFNFSSGKWHCWQLFGA